MILLITSSAQGQDCAKALLTSRKMKIEVADNVHKALNQVRKKTFSVVILDENTIDPRSVELDLLLQHLGTAVIMFINLGINRTDRVVRDVLLGLRSALRNASSRAKQWNGKCAVCSKMS